MQKRRQNSFFFLILYSKKEETKSHELNIKKFYLKWKYQTFFFSSSHSVYVSVLLPSIFVLVSSSNPYLVLVFQLFFFYPFNIKICIYIYTHTIFSAVSAFVKDFHFTPTIWKINERNLWRWGLGEIFIFFFHFLYPSISRSAYKNIKRYQKEEHTKKTWFEVQVNAQFYPFCVHFV